MDNLDTLALLFLHDFPNATTTRIARGIFGVEERDDVKRADVLIRRRLSKFVKAGVVIKTGKDPTVYKVHKGVVAKGQGILKMADGKGGWISLELGELPVIAVIKRREIVIRLFEDIKVST